MRFPRDKLLRVRLKPDIVELAKPPDGRAVFYQFNCKLLTIRPVDI